MRDLQAVIAVLDHVRKNPAAYAEPLPVSKVFNAVPGMPLRYDAGAIINEIERMKLFAIDHSDSGAMLVPAESASAKAEAAPAAPKTVPVAGRVSAHVVERLCAKAKLRGISLSALIASTLAESVETD